MVSVCTVCSVSARKLLNQYQRRWFMWPTGKTKGAAIVVNDRRVEMRTQHDEKPYWQISLSRWKSNAPRRTNDTTFFRCVGDLLADRRCKRVHKHTHTCAPISVDGAEPANISTAKRVRSATGKCCTSNLMHGDRKSGRIRHNSIFIRRDSGKMSCWISRNILLVFSSLRKQKIECQTARSNLPFHWVDFLFDLWTHSDCISFDNHMSESKFKSKRDDNETESSVNRTSVVAVVSRAQYKIKPNWSDEKERCEQ